MSGTIILLKLIGEIVALGVAVLVVVVGSVPLYRGRRFRSTDDVCRRCTGTGTEPYTDQACTAAGCDDGLVRKAA